MNWNKTDGKLVLLQDTLEAKWTDRDWKLFIANNVAASRLKNHYPKETLSDPVKFATLQFEAVNNHNRAVEDFNAPNWVEVTQSRKYKGNPYRDKMKIDWIV